MAAQVDSERGLRILCLDGAGMRNIVQIPLLEAIESAVGNGKKIHEMFDFICGSGFGGLLGIAIAINQKGQDDCRRVLHDLSTLFKASSLNVFSWYRWLWGLGYYNTRGFNQCLRNHLGELPWHTLGWMMPKLCVVSSHSHLNGRNTPCMWRTYSLPGHDGGDPLPGFNMCTTYQAARATASLPGCFRPFRHGPDLLQFVDGGVVAPNPTEFALFEAAKIWPDRRVDIVVSLGTGNSSHPEAKPAVLRQGVVTTDIEEAANRTHQAVRRWACEISQSARCYVRLDPPISKHVNFTEWNQAALDAVEQRTKSYLDLEAQEELQRLRVAFAESGDH